MRGLSKTVSRHDHDGREKSKHFPAASRIRDAREFRRPAKPPFHAHGPVLLIPANKNFKNRQKFLLPDDGIATPPLIALFPHALETEVPVHTGHNRKRFPEGWRKFFPENGQGRIHTFHGSCGPRRTGWGTAAP